MVTTALLETSVEPLALLCLAAELGSCFPDHTALHDKTEVIALCWECLRQR